MLLRQGVNKLVFFVFISHQIDRNFRTVVLLTEIVIPKSSAAESGVDYKKILKLPKNQKTHLAHENYTTTASTAKTKPKFLPATPTPHKLNRASAAWPKLRTRRLPTFL